LLKSIKNDKIIKTLGLLLIKEMSKWTQFKRDYMSSHSYSHKNNMSEMYETWDTEKKNPDSIYYNKIQRNQRETKEAFVTNCFTVCYDADISDIKIRGTVGTFKNSTDIETIKEIIGEFEDIINFENCPHDDDDNEIYSIEEYKQYYKDYPTDIYEFSYKLFVDSGPFESYCCMYHHDENTYVAYNNLINNIYIYLKSYNITNLQWLTTVLNDDVNNIIVEFLIGNV